MASLQSNRNGDYVLGTRSRLIRYVVSVCLSIYISLPVPLVSFFLRTFFFFINLIYSPIYNTLLYYIYTIHTTPRIPSQRVSAVINTNPTKSHAQISFPQPHGGITPNFQIEVESAAHLTHTLGVDTRACMYINKLCFWHLSKDLAEHCPSFPRSLKGYCNGGTPECIMPCRSHDPSERTSFATSRNSCFGR